GAPSAPGHPDGPGRRTARPHRAAPAPPAPPAVPGCAAAPSPPAPLCPAAKSSCSLCGGGVLLLHPVAVSAGLYMGDPFGVAQIPLHRLADAGVEGFCRLPAQLALQLAGIDGVAAVMSRAVGHIGDLLGVAFAVGARTQLVQQGAYGFDNV